MSHDLEHQRMIKISIALYAVIFTFIALDVLSDYGEGTDLAHIAIELLVLLITVVGLTIFGRSYYQDTQMTLHDVQSNLERAQQEAQHWREESLELIQGLGVEIQKQFSRWGLTQAESQVGLLLLKGFSHQEIANIRESSERTVRDQARSLYRKAALPGRSSLSAFFLEDLLLPSVQI
jgi:DNA-binding NarL/FixJ family response regulator